MNIAGKIFAINSDEQFEEAALAVFRFQSSYNPVYKKYLELLKCDSRLVTSTSQIPFLPIEFFKSHEVVTAHPQAAEVTTMTFASSGTTGQEVSRHIVSDLSLYEKSFRSGFELFYEIGRAHV